jgi:hypothetical protein
MDLVVSTSQQWEVCQEQIDLMDPKSLMGVFVCVLVCLCLCVCVCFCLCACVDKKESGKILKVGKSGKRLGVKFASVLCMEVIIWVQYPLVRYVVLVYIGHVLFTCLCRGGITCVTNC